MLANQKLISLIALSFFAFLNIHSPVHAMHSLVAQNATLPLQTNCILLANQSICFIGSNVSHTYIPTNLTKAAQEEDDYDEEDNEWLKLYDASLKHAATNEVAFNLALCLAQLEESDDEQLKTKIKDAFLYMQKQTKEQPALGRYWANSFFPAAFKYYKGNADKIAHSFLELFELEKRVSAIDYLQKLPAQSHLRQACIHLHQAYPGSPTEKMIENCNKLRYYIACAALEPSLEQVREAQERLYPQHRFKCMIQRIKNLFFFGISHDHELDEKATQIIAIDRVCNNNSGDDWEEDDYANPKEVCKKLCEQIHCTPEQAAVEKEYVLETLKRLQEEKKR